MERKTPRSQQREIRERRLAYFDSAGQQTSTRSDNGFPSSKTERTNNSNKRSIRINDSDAIYHGIANKEELSLEGKNFDSVVNDEFVTTDRDMDTSRTSDILMETARNYLEVLKDRESIRSKRSSNVSSKTHQPVATAASTTPSCDLTNRSVTEVLKVLGERASQRRRDLPRLSDFSESDDEEVESPMPVNEDRKGISKKNETNDNFKKIANEWAENIQLLTNQGRGDGRSSDDFKSAVGVRNGVTAVELTRHTSEKPEMNGNGALYDSHRDMKLEDLYNGDPELMEAEKELEQQQNSILRKILQNSNYPSDCLPEDLSVANAAYGPSIAKGDIRKSEPDFNSSYHPVRPTNATIAYSFDEIISQAKLQVSKGSDGCNVFNDKTQMSSPPSLRNRQEPARRSVHFDCPPTPSDVGHKKRDSSSHEVNSSVDTKSSASVVSLMSIRDVADRLEELGINPHLLGFQLTSGVNSNWDEKPRNKNKSKRFGKLCPECGKFNGDTVSWCLNCACTLIGIESQKLPRRRQRGNRSRNSSISNSYESSKDRAGSSFDLDSSNASSILGQSASKSEARSDDINETSRTYDDDSEVVQGGGDVLRHSDDYVTELPPSVKEDIVEDVLSPVATTFRDEVPTPPAMRTLKNMFGEHFEKVYTSQPVRCDATPREMRTSSAVPKGGPTHVSSDSSISLATPSPHRPNMSSFTQEDLRLSLLSSSLEDSPNSPTKKGVVDIAVLDRQDFLALRETSAASIKPESVPELPLVLSPPSTANGSRHDALSSYDMYLDDLMVPELNGVYNHDREDKPHQKNRPSMTSSVKNKGHREAKRRPGNDAYARSSKDRNDVEMRKPLSSSQQPAYRRRWKNSSTAWSTHHPSQLKKKPADYIVQQSMNSNSKNLTPSEVLFMQKNGAVLKQRNSNSVEPLLHEEKTKQHSRKPQVYHQSDDKETQTFSDRNCVPLASSVVEDSYDDVIYEEEVAREPMDLNENVSEPLALHDNTLNYLNQHGWKYPNDSPWLYLADEVWLRIFRFLSPRDLSSCAASCKRLHRVANDSSLWRCPVVKRKHEITEEELLTIGARRPISLKLKQCKGQNISLQGLKAFLNLCSTSLRKLCFSGCNHGAFSEDQFILLAAMFCPHLTSVDISFAHGVRDSTVRALAEECERLECVRLNGAQNVTDSSIKFLAERHGDSLRKIELYCCFGVSSDTVRTLSKCCSKLTHASFGSCNRISSSALIHFASHRREQLKSLDLRGMHSALDSTITSIAAVCPNIESLTLSNCGSVSNSSIRAVANHCPRLRKLDVCGCNQVGSDSAQELVRKCKHLEELDFSSTCVDHKTVTCLAHTWTPKLKCLRLNFCCNLKEDGLFRLCSNSKSLTTLYLYGIRNFGASVCNRLRKEYPRVDIKSDDNLEGSDS